MSASPHRKAPFQPARSAARRRFVQQLPAGAAALAGLSLWRPTPSLASARGEHAAPAAPSAWRCDAGPVLLEWDAEGRSRLLQRDAAGTPQPLTEWSFAESLRLAAAAPSAPAPTPAAAPNDPSAPAPAQPAAAKPPPPLTRFRPTTLTRHAWTGPDGQPGTEWRLLARSANGIERHTRVRHHAGQPGVLQIQTRFVNASSRPHTLAGWQQLGRRLPARRSGWRPGSAPLWTYSGSTHEDRRDWLQPVKPGFDQANHFGMVASDYGGGTPLVDVWRRDIGLAIGHLETVPHIVSMPVRWSEGSAALAMTAEAPVAAWAAGAELALPEGFVCVHNGDCFSALEAYREAMAPRGVVPATPPAPAYESIWCAWGYERAFTLDRVVATLPKVRDLGLEWAVLDDGWQPQIGDWRPGPRNFPRGEADMRDLVAAIHAHGLKARLWIAPLAVAPGSDALHQHPDTLLLNADGAAQDVTWWNSFTLCPAYEKTRRLTAEVITRIVGDWGFDGLKIDGQHLNAVAPCHNPAHHHARPEDSVEQMHRFYQAMYDAARAANPQAVIEVCPCGTSYAFRNFPFMNQAPASDPLSSWQVRHKGKVLRGLMGRSAAYAGDHVELSDGGQDFASTLGIGAVPSTKFTWPVDPKPKDSFLLTPPREAQWRHWIGLHHSKRLARGRYRGDLYDIAFDVPEAHVVEQDGRLHYAFYARRFEGQVPIRGLSPGPWTLRDYVNDRVVARLGAGERTARLGFEGHLLLEALPG